MKKIILTICSCLLIFSCVNRENKQVLTSPLELAPEVTIANDTLLVTDSICALFLYDYKSIYGGDTLLFVNYNIPIIHIDKNYSVINLNNNHFIDLGSIKREDHVVLYKDGKRPIVFDPYYLLFRASDYLLGRECDFDIILYDGHYLGNEFAAACYIGDTEAVKSFVEADSTIVDQAVMYGIEFSYDAFFAAMCRNHYDIAEYLIENGTEVNIIYGECYDTPLSKVVKIQNSIRSYELAKLLIDRGANVNGAGISFTHQRYFIPITTAIEYRKIDIIELLVENNVELILEDRPENYLLSCVVDEFSEDEAIEIVYLFLETGVFSDIEGLVEISEMCK